MLEAKVAVQSRDMSLAEITAVLRRDPHAGYDRGTVSPVGSKPRAWASWAMTLSWPSEVHGGTDGLSQAIEALGLPFARLFASLAGRGCVVVISVHQTLSADPWSTGLHLTPAAVRWIAAAGASVDVDQYVIDDEVHGLIDGSDVSQDRATPE